MFNFNISEINYRRLKNFKANKRGFRSFKIFLFLFFFTLFAEFIANDKPLLVNMIILFIFQFLKIIQKRNSMVILKLILITKILI